MMYESDGCSFSVIDIISIMIIGIILLVIIPIVALLTITEMVHEKRNNTDQTDDDSMPVRVLSKPPGWREVLEEKWGKWKKRRPDYF